MRYGQTYRVTRLTLGWVFPIHELVGCQPRKTSIKKRVYFQTQSGVSYCLGLLLEVLKK